MTATGVTSAGFETGQLRNSLSNFETWPKFNFGKPGDFETGPCNLAGSGFETEVAVRALRLCATGVSRRRSFNFTAVAIVRQHCDKGKLIR
jgi:hypothetical protein